MAAHAARIRAAGWSGSRRFPGSGTPESDLRDHQNDADERRNDRQLGSTPGDQPRTDDEQEDTGREGLAGVGADLARRLPGPNRGVGRMPRPSSETRSS